MIVNENDKLSKKIKWWIITFCIDISIMVVFFILPFILGCYLSNFFILISFFGFWLGGKLCYRIENYIGMRGFFQNPRSHQLIEINMKPIWGQREKCKTIKPNMDKHNVHSCRRPDIKNDSTD